MPHKLLAAFNITATSFLSYLLRAIAGLDTSLWDLRGKLENKSVEDVEAVELQGIPMGRFIRSEEIADLTAFLSSDRASSIVGQNIAIDGGASEAVFY